MSQDPNDNDDAVIGAAMNPSAPEDPLAQIDWEQVVPLGTPPQLVLRRALGIFENIGIASSLGPQTLVIIDMLYQGGHEVPVFLLDTDLLFKETYDLKEQVEEHYNMRIQAIRPDISVHEQAIAHGDDLWERDTNRCCGIRKVVPLRRALAPLDAWITGLRRDQARTRANTMPVQWDDVNGLWRVAPLATWSREQVFDYLRTNNVPYNPLLEQGYKSVGCWPCTRKVATDGDERDGRWAGSGKTECGIHFLFEDQKDDDPKEPGA